MFQSIKNNRGFGNKSVNSGQLKRSKVLKFVFNWEGALESRTLLTTNLPCFFEINEQKVIETSPVVPPDFNLVDPDMTPTYSLNSI